MIVIAEIILTVDPDRPEMEHGIVKTVGEIKKEVTDIPNISYEDKSLCEFVAGQFVKASEYKYNYFYDGSANPGILKLKKGQSSQCIYSEKRKCKEERTDQSSESGNLVCKR